jgi:peptidoglycan/LPS O-acetylase OafA/YrhL
MSAAPVAVLEVEADLLPSPVKRWTPTYSGHLPALDGLRGIAVLMVVIYHYAFELPHGHGIGGAIYELLHQGRHGVDLFFVLSGFLITGILLDSKRSPRYFSTFYARRTLRIFPLYYGVLFAVLVLWPLFATPGPRAREVMHDQGWLWLYGTNILVSMRDTVLFNAEHFNLAHFWSLAVEEQFYLVWPLLVLALSRRALGWVCVALLPLALVTRWAFEARADLSLAAYYFTVCRVDALAIGALVAVLARSPGGLAALRKPALWILPITAVLWAASLPSTGGKHWDFSVHFIYTPVGLFCGALVCLALTSPPWSSSARVLCAAPLRFFGKYSYGLYVFHFLLYPAFQALYARFPLPAALHRGALGLAGLGIVSTIGSVSVAWLSYNLYEKQFLKLKSRFNY